MLAPWLISCQSESVLVNAEVPQAVCPDELELVYLGIDTNEIQEARREEVLAVAWPVYTLLDKTSCALRI